MSFYFGSHISLLHKSISKGLIDSATDVKKAGGNIVQIFLPTLKIKVELDNLESELEIFNKFLVKNKMKVVVHSSYMHNLCADWDTTSWWLKNIELEIKYSQVINAIGLVLHFGKQKELTLSEAYNNMYTL